MPDAAGRVPRVLVCRPEHRRAGLSRLLTEAAEGWARARGCTEKGSDADLSDEVSRAAHRALGYGEVSRLVLFAKRLVPKPHRSRARR